MGKKCVSKKIFSLHQYWCVCEFVICMDACYSITRELLNRFEEYRHNIPWITTKATFNLGKSMDPA